MSVGQIRATTAGVPMQVSGPDAGWVAQYPHELLSTPCLDVTEFDDSLQALAARLIETRVLLQGLGVAANQVGDRRRVMGWAWERSEYVVVNPVLSNHEGAETNDEGCLSMNGIYVSVERASSVHLDGFDLEGNPWHGEAHGLLAIMWQHEVDHLDGVMNVDHLNRQQQRNALRHWAKRRRQLGLD